MTDLHGVISPDLVKNKLPGLPGFLQTLAGYYCQFLETDFKKGREPKRKFVNKDASGKRIGIKASKYPALKKQLVQKLNQKTPASFLITPQKYRSSLSVSVSTAINAAIDSIELDGLEKDLDSLKWKVASKVHREGFDIEEVVEDTSTSLQGYVDTHIVSRVLDILSPIFERQSSSSIAFDQLLSYADEISSILTEEAESRLPTALSDLAFRKSEEGLNETFAQLSDVEMMRGKLKEYFSEFAASDVFTELRELLANQLLKENTQIYLNFGEIRTSKSVFPLYFLPLTVKAEKTAIRITFESHIFVNKKAVEFVAGVISKDKGITIPNPLSDRIFYKGEEETYIDVANQTFHKVLIALQVEGEIDLSTSGDMSGSGPDIKVTNDISFLLSDKSDESIVNDYEALMSGLEGGSDLLAAFSDLIENFLTQNPVSIEESVDQDWNETDTPDRLVFQSPLPLAEEQRKVLAAIRDSKSRLISVEGPPGTGKSHTIAAIAFEMILKGKNILILSDKKEALDVAENKLNDVIEKVRGDQTEYVNPILRLGKTDSNYSNIIKSNSINKLKTSFQTFKANEGEFNRLFDAAETGLKNNIQNTIDSAALINFSSLFEFHQSEEKLFNEFPFLDELSESDMASLPVLFGVSEIVKSKRDSFAPLFSGDTGLTSMAEYLELVGVINKVPDSITQLLRRYPKLDIGHSEELSDLSIKIKSFRKPLIGYLFSGSSLRKVGTEVSKITGEFTAKPQKIISDIERLSMIKEKVKDALLQYGKDRCHVDAFIRFIISRFRTTEEENEVLINYLKLDHTNSSVHEEFIPKTIKRLLSLKSEESRLLKAHSELLKMDKVLLAKFNRIPDFDYLKDKTHLEVLNATRLVNCMDDRVIRLAMHSRTDAKIFQKIIKNKERFPTDKFDQLSEAFPCMIAGLRDFAEFIPLKENLFDLIIIDEASQVSIAQALPALLRSKKMIVMGDRRQFGNVKTANASKALNQAYFSKVREEFSGTVAHGDIALKKRCEVFNITNSVMDFFEMTSNFSIQLRKHFRGYPEMISFSSKYFYDATLQTLKIRGKPISDVIEFIEVSDQERIEVVKNSNRQEANFIVSALVKLIEQDEPPSVAIITPFREQQRVISHLVTTHERHADFAEKLKIAVFTFDSCQGEERDFIYYSMVASRQVDQLNYIFPLDLENVTEDVIDGKLKFQRMNVGFSRGKEKLIFVLSKPIEEFKGGIGQALRHYKEKLLSSLATPTADQVDPSSPMEAELLGWINATSFVSANSGRLEIIPQFKIGEYLKALDNSYSHPDYKVDFLLRLKINSDVLQVIIEYDGFEFHFTNRSQVDSTNWRSYLTPGDIERECILESYGYKMLRVNRFNIGSDPISTIDERLKDLFEELVSKNEKHHAIASMQAQTTENIQGLEAGTHKKCSSCDKIKVKSEFYDSTLKTKYGRTCSTCKIGSSRSRSFSGSRKRSSGYRRRW